MYHLNKTTSYKYWKCSLQYELKQESGWNADEENAACKRLTNATWVCCEWHPHLVTLEIWLPVREMKNSGLVVVATEYILKWAIITKMLIPCVFSKSLVAWCFLRDSSIFFPHLLSCIVTVTNGIQNVLSTVLLQNLIFCGLIKYLVLDLVKGKIEFERLRRKICLKETICLLPVHLLWTCVREINGMDDFCSGWNAKDNFMNTLVFPVAKCRHVNLWDHFMLDSYLFAHSDRCVIFL